MSERDALFRAEALEYRARGRDGPGGVLRIGRRWLRWSYWTLLALVVAGLLLATVVRTQESTTGPAVVDLRSRTFSAFVPLASAPELPQARAVRLDLPDGRLQVKVLQARPVNANTRTAGLPAPRQAALLLSGRVLSGGAAPRGDAMASRSDARLTIVLRSERVGAMMLRKFKGMLGDGGGGS